MGADKTTWSVQFGTNCYWQEFTTKKALIEACKSMGMTVEGNTVTRGNLKGTIRKR